MNRSAVASNTLLSINNYYYRRGGAEVVFLDHNQLATDAGWNVVPFSMQHPNNQSSEWSEHFIQELEFGAEYSLPRRISMASKIVYSLEAQQKLRSLIQKTRPKIAHLHNIYHHISPSILSTLKSEKVPTIMTLHDLKVACPAYKMLTHDGVCERCKGGNFRNLVTNRCIKGSLLLSSLVYLESTLHRYLSTYTKHVDRFVVPSRFYINKLIEWGFSEEQMIYIPNFIDTDEFQKREDVGDYYAYVGRLAPEKGLETLIRAAKKAGVRIKVIGSGPDDLKLQALARELGVKAEFTGSLFGNDLRTEISVARALVLPSEWYENAPISVLEAYASGVPVIGADIGGIPEMIDHSVTGLIFASGSVPALSQALSDFDQLSQSEILTMGACAREMAETHFSKQQYTDRVLRLYGELIAECAA